MLCFASTLIGCLCLILSLSLINGFFPIIHALYFSCLLVFGTSPHFKSTWVVNYSIRGITKTLWQLINYTKRNKHMIWWYDHTHHTPLPLTTYSYYMCTVLSFKFQQTLPFISLCFQNSRTSPNSINFSPTSYYISPSYSSHQISN